MKNKNTAPIDKEKIESLINNLVKMKSKDFLLDFVFNHPNEIKVKNKEILNNDSLTPDDKRVLEEYSKTSDFSILLIQTFKDKIEDYPEDLKDTIISLLKKDSAKNIIIKTENIKNYHHNYSKPKLAYFSQSEKFKSLIPFNSTGGKRGKILKYLLFEIIDSEYSKVTKILAYENIIKKVKFKSEASIMDYKAILEFCSEVSLKHFKETPIEWTLDSIGIESDFEIIDFKNNY